jgi:hypothetical protein
MTIKEAAIHVLRENRKAILSADSDLITKLFGPAISSFAGALANPKNSKVNEGTLIGDE